MLEQIALIFADEEDKSLKVVQKLCQIGVLSHDQILKYALTRLGQPLATQMLKEALIRESLNKWQVVTRFYQKPPKESQTFAEENRDEVMEDDQKEKPMSLQEYEAEFNQCLEKEIELFCQAQRMILATQGHDDVLKEIYQDVETPFVSTKPLEAVPEGALKQKLALF